MKALESLLLTYLLNSLWQVPLVFAAAWIATRVVRHRSVAMEHRIWVSAMMLEVILPACSGRPSELWQLLRRVLGTGAVGGDVQVTMGPGAALEHGLLQLSPTLLTTIAVVYACSFAYFAGRLAWGIWTTNGLRRQAERITMPGQAGICWEKCCRYFDVNHAEAAVSSDIVGPMTVGVRHRILLLPVAWQTTLQDDDLSAAIAHEFAHMRRRDFAKNLMYEVLSLPVAYHPLLWLTRSHIAESREMICDAMAADAVSGREKYARSLLRLASTFSERTPARTLHAIGIFDANNFERRVMSLTEKRVELRGLRRVATVAECVLLGVGPYATAVALRVEVPTGQEAPVVAGPHGPARVSGAVMAGNVLTRVNPVYPADAKAAGVNGAVVLHAIIGKVGTIERLDVVSGPAELRSSALNAVKQWTYKPYLLNGNPVEVDTTVTVTYQLNP
jgi:TonB family protein